MDEKMELKSFIKSNYSHVRKMLESKLFDDQKQEFRLKGSMQVTKL